MTIMAYGENETTKINKPSEPVTDNEPQIDESNTPQTTPPCKLNLELLPSKLFYFTFFSAIAVTLPYTSIFMKQLGMSAFHIGLISGLRPILGFLSGICWGILADKFKIWRPMLFVSIVFWGLFYALFYMIPMSKRNFNCLNLYQNSSNGTNLSTELSPTSHNYSKENLSWLYDEKELTVTFIMCLIYICIGELLQSPTSSVGDALTLRILGGDNLHLYGFQRAWGSVGTAMNALLAGYLLGELRWTEVICGITLSFSNYKVLSMLVSIFTTLCFLGSCFMGKNKCPTTDHEAQECSSTWAVLKLFCNVHYGSWILSILYTGYCMGTSWGFVFWHVDNLGGSQFIMGIDYFVLNIVETIAYCTANYFIKLVGHINVIYISLICWSFRFALYASLVNPWWIILIDVLQGITFSTSWISFTLYSALMVPADSLATIQGILHAVLFGVGNGLGHLISGIFIDLYGAVATFYGMAVATIVFLLIFLCFQKVSLDNDMFVYIAPYALASEALGNPEVRDAFYTQLTGTAYPRV